MLEYKQIATRIGAVAKLSTEVQNEVQILVCNIVGHAVDHGNVTLATDLVNAMGNGTRKQAVVTFLEKKGCFRYVKASDGTHAFRLHKERRAEMVGTKTGEMWCEELLQGEAWYDFTPEKVKSVYDTFKMVETIIRATEAKLKKGEKVEHADLVPFLTEAMAKWRLTPPTPVADVIEIEPLRAVVNA